MRGKLIKVRAKKTLEGIFTIGDILHVQSVLLDKPKFLHGAMGVWLNAKKEPEGLLPKFKDLELYQMEEKTLGDGKTKNYRVNVCEDTYAPVGSFSHAIIITSDGKEHSDKILGNKSLSYAFEKI